MKTTKQVHGWISQNFTRDGIAGAFRTDGPLKFGAPWTRATLTYQVSTEKTKTVWQWRARRRGEEWRVAPYLISERVADLKWPEPSWEKEHHAGPFEVSK